MLGPEIWISFIFIAAYSFDDIIPILKSNCSFIAFCLWLKPSRLSGNCSSLALVSRVKDKHNDLSFNGQTSGRDVSRTRWPGRDRYSGIPAPLSGWWRIDLYMFILSSHTWWESGDMDDGSPFTGQQTNKNRVDSIGLVVYGFIYRS